MKVDRVCECCRKPFTARSADVKRGWARFCSKRCKAIVQDRARVYTPYPMAVDISDIHDLDEPR